jgi:hypothetical protein
MDSYYVDENKKTLSGFLIIMYYLFWKNKLIPLMNKIFPPKTMLSINYQLGILTYISSLSCLPRYNQVA